MSTNSRSDPKERAHRFDPDRGEVCLVDIPARSSVATAGAATSTRVIALTDLGRQIEQHFDAPMDIEWAIAGSGDQREISLLQARPETVWSQKSDAETIDRGQDDWDPLHSTSAPGVTLDDVQPRARRCPGFSPR